MAKFSANFSVIVFYMMLVSTSHAESISCGTVAGSLAPCVNYLKGGEALPEACCSGVKSLNAVAKTTTDRQAACYCLKSLAKSMPNLNPQLASTLPSQCGINIDNAISYNTNCNKIK